MKISILGIAVLAFLFLCVMDGLKKGIVEAAIRLVSSVFGLVLLFVLLKAIGNVMNGSYFHVVVAILFLATLLAVHKVADIILKSCKLISELPVISWVNKIAGAVFGLAQGVIGIWICFIVFGFFDLPVIQPWIMEQVEQSKFISILYHSNYIIYLLRNFM